MHEEWDIGMNGEWGIGMNGHESDNTAQMSPYILAVQTLVVVLESAVAAG